MKKTRTPLTPTKNKLDLTALSVSSLAIGSRVVYGLFFYPYQTVLELTMHRVFLPIVMVPVASFALIKLVWYLIITPWLAPNHTWLLSLLANWIVWFLALWQGLLIYLTVRFWRALH